MLSVCHQPLWALYFNKARGGADQSFAALIPTDRIGLTLWRLTRGRYHWEVAAGGAPSQSR